MGAWGYGLMQNDTVQDALVGLIAEVRADVARIGEASEARPELAGRLTAAVGLLLQMQARHCFDPEHEFVATTVQAALGRQAPAFAALPKTAVDLLMAIRGGQGLDLAEQAGPLPDELYQAFFDSEPGFLMERGTGVRHPGMFEHPAGAAYVQEVADRCVAQLTSLFASPGEPPDFGNEAGDEIAALCVLLQLEPCRVPPERFRDWWDRYLAASDDEEYEEEYEKKYRRCLWAALNHGHLRFSGEPKPAPLPEGKAGKSEGA